MATTDEGRPPQGQCCDAMREILAAEDFEPLLQIGEDGVLYMSIGISKDDDAQAADPADGEEGPALLDHPVYFCPFCGTAAQTEEEVEKRIAAASREDDEG